MRISELGEFGLIDVINGIVRQNRDDTIPAWRELIIGIGDDAALWRRQSGLELATTDTLVQDVHFTFPQITWRELGWKSLAINLSDIAAMGGVPVYALVSLALPVDTEVDGVAEFYEGMAGLAGECGVAIVGGNLAESGVIVTTVSVLGTLEGDAPPLTRSAAKPGDLVAVTGNLGLSAAGHRMLGHGLRFGQATADLFRRAHTQPEARVVVGQLLRSSGVRAAVDISDGLVSDLGHICAMSGVSAHLNVEKLPVHRLLRAAFPRGYRELALYGGEDYELLFTAPARVVSMVKQSADCPITVLGRIVVKESESVILSDRSGQAYSRGRAGYQRGGWEHFKPVSGK